MPVGALRLRYCCFAYASVQITTHLTPYAYFRFRALVSGKNFPQKNCPSVPPRPPGSHSLDLKVFHSHLSYFYYTFVNLKTYMCIAGNAGPAIAGRAKRSATCHSDIHLGTYGECCTSYIHLLHIIALDQLCYLSFHLFDQ